MIKSRIPTSGLTRQTLEENRRKTIEIQMMSPNYTGTLFNLKDFDIKYQIKDKLDDSESLYADKILYIKQK